MNVSPTNSGTMVQARAQVVTGSLEPVCSRACTFLKTLKSTYGPFFVDLLMRYPVNDLLQFELTVPPRLAAADDGRVGRLAVLPRTATLGRHARGADRMTATLGASFATAVRMVDRVHRGAADGRPNAEPSLAPRF